MNAADSSYARPLVLALLSVNGASAACAEHGDEATVCALQEYYRMTSELIADTGGRVVKVIGDGIVITFPSSRAADVRRTMQQTQSATTRHWQAFDPRCRVVVRVGAGTVIAAPMGPPDDQRDDIYGRALNDVFKASGGDFVTLPSFDDVERSG